MWPKFLLMVSRTRSLSSESSRPFSSPRGTNITPPYWDQNLQSTHITSEEHQSTCLSVLSLPGIYASAKKEQELTRQGETAECRKCRKWCWNGIQKHKYNTLRFYRLFTIRHMCRNTQIMWREEGRVPTWLSYN